MDRRTFLAGVSVAAVPGCLGRSETDAEGGGSETATEEPTVAGVDGTRRLENGVEVTLQEARRIDTLEYRKYRRQDPQPLEADGEYIVCLVAAENAASQPASTPSDGDFAILAGGDQIDFDRSIPGQTDGESTEIYYTKLESPFEDVYRSNWLDGDVHPGVVEDGWLPFAVPEKGLDLRLALDFKGSFYWSIPSS